MVAKYSDFPGHIDVICGGFPCQDISVGGKRTGISGSRSSLWRYMLRAIRVVRPKYAIVENVAALLDNGMGRVCGDLAEVGYDTEWHCIPASYVGAFHQRDRVWIICYPNGRDAGLCRAPIIQDISEWKAKEVGKDWIGQLDELGAGNVAQRADSYAGALRVLDGIPNRSHRLKALGNSLYPRIPEIIGSHIMQLETTKG